MAFIVPKLKIMMKILISKNRQNRGINRWQLWLWVIILYMNGEANSLKSASKDTFLRNYFYVNFYLLFEYLPEIC